MGIPNKWPLRRGAIIGDGHLKERAIYIKKIFFRRGVYWRGGFKRETVFMGENMV